MSPYTSAMYTSAMTWLIIAYLAFSLTKSLYPELVKFRSLCITLTVSAMVQNTAVYALVHDQAWMSCIITYTTAIHTVVLFTLAMHRSIWIIATSIYSNRGTWPVVLGFLLISLAGYLK